ncbi:phosphatase PAP2 family protein [Streptomyces sp. NPDC001380]|uniref:phosphatase PAP2 family protein n=1 Tax=Streptomyces sp. NPDC001380 TaxID=3364566 RepID=UPI00368B9CA0
MLLLLFLAVSLQVSGHGPLLGLDDEVRDAVARTDQALPSGTLRPAADHAAQLLSDLGGAGFAVPVLLGCAAVAAWRSRRSRTPRWWAPLAAAGLTAPLIPLLVVPAKAYFARPGPDGTPLLPGQWGWYPSGHTATSAIAYGAGALLLARVLTRVTARTAVRAAAVLLSAGVGVGLLWCDYHWFLDVLASWCLAGVVLWCLARLLPAARSGPS